MQISVSEQLMVSMSESIKRQEMLAAVSITAIVVDTRGKHYSTRQGSFCTGYGSPFPYTLAMWPTAQKSIRSLDHKAVPVHLMLY